MERLFRSEVVGVLVLWFLTVAACALADEAEPSPDSGPGVYSLKEFGPVSTRAEADESYRKALEALTRAGGGILVVPQDTYPHWRYENTAQTSHSVDPASCELRDWKYGSGITVVDLRSHALGFPGISVPQGTGLTLNRTMRFPRGDSLPHWSTNPVLRIQNNIVHGSNSYLDWLQEPVKAGKDRRFYLPSIRGIFPGQFLNAHSTQGYGYPVARLTVKSLGYDPEKKKHYFVADTTLDHQTGAIIHNKNHTSGLWIETDANATNQTFDLSVIRNHYANGDTYLVFTRFDYMGNIHSAAGDENGVCFGAFTHSRANIFRGTVESVNWDVGKLTFKSGQNVETLSNSRPLINMNPEKWITGGKVLIVPPESYHDAVDSGKWAFEGKTYPSQIVHSEISGAAELRMGGLIRGTKDCPWTEEVVGRFFAVDEESEYVEGTVRRWYEVTALEVNLDGTKDIKIRRFWWGAKEAGSPTLYDPENYTRDGHVRELSYVIAPGTYVCDVSEAVNPNRASGAPARSALYLAPYRDQGTEFDFEPGDAIEQAVGADPWKPIPFRAWLWDNVPSAWADAVFDVKNYGSVARNSVLQVGGGPKTLDGCEKRRDRRPPWDKVIEIDSAARVGLDCNADFSDAAILFRQPNVPQAIKWRYDDGRKEAVLTVSPRTGDVEFAGGNVSTGGGSLLRAKGLSATQQEARNLRGIDVPVPEGATSAAITFETPEADGHYAVMVETNWLTGQAVVSKAKEGFTVAFERAAPDGASLDWILIR